MSRTQPHTGRPPVRMTLEQYITRHSTWPLACAALGISDKHLDALVKRRKNPSFELAWKIWTWTGGRVTPGELTPADWTVTLGQPEPVQEDPVQTGDSIEASPAP